MASLISLIELFRETLYQIYTVNYITVAAFTVLLYDAFLSFSREVEFIWRKPFSFPKSLYLVSRYYGLLSLGTILFMSILSDRSLSSCHIFLISASSVGPQIVEMAVNAILFLRICALYGKSKKVIYLILPLYLAEIVCIFYGGITAGVRDAKGLMDLPLGISVPGCYLYVRETSSFKFTVVAWVPALFLSAVFFGLSLYKVYEKAIANYAPSGMLHQKPKLPKLMRVILRDGVIFYFVNTFVTILGAALIIRVHSPIIGFVPPVDIMVYSLCGCHFLLNFYETAKDSSNSEAQVTGVHVAFRSPGKNVIESESSGTTISAQEAV